MGALLDTRSQLNKNHSVYLSAHGCRRPSLGLALCFFLSFPGFASAQDLGRSIREVVSQNQQKARLQRRVNQLDDQTLSMQGRFRVVSRLIETQKAYNAQLQKLVSAQDTQKRDLEAKIESVEQVRRELLPLSSRMIQGLEDFLALDLPFHTEERQSRIAQLKALQERPDVSEPERFRRLVEAFKAELNYGSTVESYRAEIPAADGSDKPRAVTLIRVGRISLSYLSLDAQEAGWYNPESRRYEKLDERYRRALVDALRVIDEQSAPRLIGLPVPMPKASMPIPAVKTEAPSAPKAQPEPESEAT